MAGILPLTRPVDGSILIENPFGGAWLHCTFRGRTHCGTTEIVTPNRPKKNATAYEKRKAKARFRRRAAIEPRIGHLKSDFRLGRNFLKGHDRGQELIIDISKIYRADNRLLFLRFEGPALQGPPLVPGGYAASVGRHGYEPRRSVTK